MSQELGSSLKIASKATSDEVEAVQAAASPIISSLNSTDEAERPVFGDGMPAQIKSINQFSEVFSTSFVIDNKFLPEDYGLAFDNQVELQVVAFESFIPGNSGLDETSVLFPIIEASAPILPERDSDMLFETEMLNNEITDTKSAQPDQISDRLPIFGHSLDVDGENLELTEAVDVVFYDGGDATISNFDLGTDLLWFS